MLNNHFVYETPDFLDLPYIQQLVMKTIAFNETSESINEYAYYGINVEEDQYLKSIKKRFAFLSLVLNIYNTKRPLGQTLLHIDAYRKAAFNIPIEGCDETTQTIFYKSAIDAPLISEYVPAHRYHIITSEVEEIYRMALIRPALIRNDVPHEVKRFNAIGPRIIASWGVSGTFEQCRDSFQEILGPT